MVFLVQPVIAFVNGHQEINTPVTKSLQDVCSSDDEALCRCVSRGFSEWTSRLFALSKPRRRKKSKDADCSGREAQLRRLETDFNRSGTSFQIRELDFFQIKSFSKKELRLATNNFSVENIVGQNEICRVYKGKLSGGSTVAIVTSHSEQVILEFETRLKVSSMAIHKNLLPLFGYCQTGKTRLLVFPLMSNGDLTSHLEKGSLNWTTRKKVALGVARGLAHMHEYCHTKIIHRDMKPSSILLNDNFEPVIANIFCRPMDFASCSVEQPKSTRRFSEYDYVDDVITHVITRCPETLSYTAPEYMATRICSEKTDVFAFGITILQLASGWSRPHLLAFVTENPMLIGWVRKLVRERKFDMLADPKLQGRYVMEEMSQMIKVGLLCTSDCPKNRPQMSEVIKTLEGMYMAPEWENICQELNCIDRDTCCSRSTLICSLHRL